MRKIINNLIIGLNVFYAEKNIYPAHVEEPN